MSTAVRGVVGLALLFVPGAQGLGTSLILGAVMQELGPKPQDTFGPRLSDSKIQTSEYGRPLGKIYGTMRKAGTVIWQTPKVESRSTTSSGGKGGGGGSSTTTYSYSQSFAIAICEGPIVGIRRIWLDGKLVYNSSSTADSDTLEASDNIPFRLYLGSESQGADALIQADLGVANTPAYRGTAYVVFENQQLADTFNRVGNYEFEVVTAGTRTTGGSPSGSISNVGGTQQYGYLKFGLLNTYDSNGSGLPVIVQIFNGLSPAGTGVITPQPGAGIGSVDDHSLQFVSVTVAFQQTGTQLRRDGITISATVARPANSISVLPSSACSDTTGTVMGWASSDGLYWLLIGRDDGTGTAATPLTVLPGLEYVNYVGATTNQALYTTPRYDPDTGHFYLRMHESIIRIGKDGKILKAWIGLLTGIATNTLNWSIHSGLAVIQTHPPSGAVTARQLNEDGTVTLVVNTNGLNHLSFRRGKYGAYGKRFDSNQWCIWDFHPVVTLDTAANTVSSIVSSLCLQSGLVAGDINVVALTDTLSGYLVNRSTLRSSLEPLLKYAYADAIESDGKIKFVKRAGDVALTIQEDDLAAHQYGSDVPDQLPMSRASETELPVEITVGYMDSNADYLIGIQYARRITSVSKNIIDVQMPMAIAADKAKQISNVLLYAAWQSRNSFSVVLSSKYSYLEPTDVIRVVKGGRTYTLRIVDKSEDSGIYRFSVVQEDTSTYTQPAAAQGIVPPPPTVLPLSHTKLLLLDIPLVRDQDDGLGFYSAVHGYLSGWGGAQVFKSSDAGATWATYGDILLNEAVSGNATSALGDFPSGNIFDERNTVTISLPVGTLSSITELAALNGGNLALIGNEILQFKTASLTAASTYTLSGFLRGRRGTEWAMPTHAVNDRFVLLSATTIYLNIAGSAEFNLARKYRGVTIGQLLSDATTIDFTHTSVAQECYSPVLLGGGRDAAGNITLNWTRRTRVGGSWNDYVDASLGEATQSYTIEIYSSATFVTLLRTLAAVVQTVAYTSAMQVTDFGSNQATVHWRVAQVSASVGSGYFTRSST